MNSNIKHLISQIAPQTYYYTPTELLSWIEEYLWDITNVPHSDMYIRGGTDSLLMGSYDDIEMSMRHKLMEHICSLGFEEDEPYDTAASCSFRKIRK